MILASYEIESPEGLIVDEGGIRSEPLSLVGARCFLPDGARPESFEAMTEILSKLPLQPGEVLSVQLREYQGREVKRLRLFTRMRGQGDTPKTQKPLD